MTAVSGGGTQVISVGAMDSKLPWALTLAALRLKMRAHGNPGWVAGEGLVMGGNRGTDRLWVGNQSHLASHTDDQDFQL